MAEDIISSIIDEAAIEKQFANLDSSLSALAEKIKTFPTLNIGSSVESLKDLTVKSKEYTATLTGMSNSTSSVINSEKQLAAAMQQSLGSVQQQKTALEQAIKARISYQNILASVKEEEKENANLLKQGTITQKEYRDRLVETGVQQEKLRIRISETSKEIKDQIRLNEISRKAPGSIKEAQAQNVSLTQQRNLVNGGTGATDADLARIAQLNALIDRNNQLIDANSDKLSKQKINIGNYNAAAQLVVDSLEKEKIKLQSLTTGYQNFSQQVQVSRNVITGFAGTASNPAGFKAAQSSIIATAAKLTDLKTEIGESKTKIEGFNKTLSSDEFAKFGKKAETSADSVKKVATETAKLGGGISKAFGGLRTLANILPGIGLSGLFLGAFEILTSLVKEVGLFNGKLSETAKQREMLNRLEDDAAKNGAKETANLQVLRTVIESTKAPMDARLQAVKDLKKEYPDYFGNLSNEEILTGKVAGAYERAADAILKKARAQAASTQIEENSLKQLKLREAIERDQSETAEKIKNAQAQTRVISGGTGGVGGTDISVDRSGVQREIRRQFEARQNQRTDELVDIQKSNDFLLQFVVDGAQKRTEAVTKGGAKVLESTKATLDSEFELYKINQKRKIDISKSVIDDDKESFTARLLFLQSYLQNSLELINREQLEEVRKNQEKEAALQANLKKAKGTERNNLLIEIQNTQTARKVIEARGEDERLRLAMEGQKRLSDLQDGEESASGKRSEERQKEINARLHKILQDFVDGQAEIEDKARKDKEKKDKAAADREVQYQKRKADLIKDLYKEIQSAIFQFLDDGLKRQEQDLDERKRLLDTDTEKRINDINQLGLTEVERVKQTSAVQKEAQFQTEQIEARKRAISVQRAKYEKAASIATIIESTAEAVMAALAFGPPEGYILASLAGAIGAVQLAKAISTPLPKYKGGRGPGKDEYAVVGDGGVHEFIKRKKGGIEITPAYSSITHLGAEDVVYKDEHALVNAMLNATMRGSAQGGNNATDAPIWELVAEQRRTTRAVQNMKQSILIKNAPGIESSAWYLKHIKN